MGLDWTKEISPSMRASISLFFSRRIERDYLSSDYPQLPVMPSQESLTALREVADESTTDSEWTGP